MAHYYHTIYSPYIIKGGEQGKYCIDRWWQKRRRLASVYGSNNQNELNIYFFVVRDIKERKKSEEQEPVSDKRIFSSLKWIEHVTSIIIRDITQRRKWSWGCSDWEKKIIPPTGIAVRAIISDTFELCCVVGWLFLLFSLSFSTSQQKISFLDHFINRSTSQFHAASRYSLKHVMIIIWWPLGGDEGRRGFF